MEWKERSDGNGMEVERRSCSLAAFPFPFVLWVRLLSMIASPHSVRYGSLHLHLRFGSVPVPPEWYEWQRNELSEGKERVKEPSESDEWQEWRVNTENPISPSLSLSPPPYPSSGTRFTLLTFRSPHAFGRVRRDEWRRMRSEDRMIRTKGMRDEIERWKGWRTPYGPSVSRHFGPYGVFQSHPPPLPLIRRRRGPSGRHEGRVEDDNDCKY